MTVTFESGVLNSLAPWAPAGSDLQKYTSALAAMFEQCYGLVADQGSPDEPASFTAGWSTLLDPSACPAGFLPYCGMFVGSVVPPGTDEATARAQILAEQNFNRGTGFAGTYTSSNGAAGGAIVLAAQRFLSGTQSVGLVERSPDPYSAVVVCRPEEVIDQAQLEASVLAVKPAGIVIQFVFTDAYLWNQAIHTFSADTMTWSATASTQP